MTSRIQEGLPMVASLHLNLIIWDILARARSQHDVKVCHFLFMYNHFHMLLVVDNPNDVPKFIGYIKAEISHAINQLLGRRSKTIWEEGYDSPEILTPNDVINKIKYIYTNPLLVNLVEKVSDYPGVSSWPMYINKETSKHCKWIRRPGIEQQATPATTINEQRRISERLERNATISHEFILEPNAWMDCFYKYGDLDKDLENELIQEILKREEEYLAKERQGKSVIGRTALRRQSMLKVHTPKKWGRRTICICSNKELRIAFLGFYKDLCRKAKEVYEQWKLGNLTIRIPPGLFSPALPKLQEALVL